MYSAIVTYNFARKAIAESFMGMLASLGMEKQKDESTFGLRYDGQTTVEEIYTHIVDWSRISQKENHSRFSADDCVQVFYAADNKDGKPGIRMHTYTYDVATNTMQ